MIRFIYFDLGNVIVHFSHARSRDQMAQLAGIEPEIVERVVFQDGLQNRYESGEINSEQFAAEFNRLTSARTCTDQLVAAASDIFWLNRPLLPVLAALRWASFPIGILSNTCPAHWQDVLTKSVVLPDYFCQTVLSYEKKCMKPGAQIYRQAIAATGLAPEQIFFTDDRPENVRAAADCGIDAYQFESVPDLIGQLVARGIPLNL